MHTVVKGNIFIVSAPSGAGKSSLLRALCQQHPEMRVAVSHTTRSPRSGEQNGVHYHFISQETFIGMVENSEFLEHAQIFDNYYGTAESELRNHVNAGINLILEIDWQGAKQVLRRFPDACTIFILPPSLELLRERLTRRAQDAPEVIARRMRDAHRELSHYIEYDYLVVNDRFETALDELHCIVTSQNLKTINHAPKLVAILRELLDESTVATESDF
ncbi:guanylate kinase [Achromatium sp. WMS2]|nr:guanylate kinase [Achromatium sp. WMS2]